MSEGEGGWYKEEGVKSESLSTTKVKGEVSGTNWCHSQRKRRKPSIKAVCFRWEAPNMDVNASGKAIFTSLGYPDEIGLTDANLGRKKGDCLEHLIYSLGRNFLGKSVSC